MKPQNIRIQMAAAALREGHILAYPTEAVWGLGCLPENRAAVLALLALKNRPESKGLILVSGTIEHFGELLEGLSAQALEQLTQSWPGPNTWLVPHHQRVPPWVCGQHASVAIRVSTHPVIRALSAAVGGPIVSTSANPQGLPPAKSAFRVRRYFGEQVCYAPGQIGAQAKPSQIRDLLTGRILRPA